MLWVGLFIVGLFGMLAGIIPMILNGLRAPNAVASLFGIILLVAGGFGVIAKPESPAFRLPRLSLGGSSKPAAPAPPETPVAMAEAPRPEAPMPAPDGGDGKDESQLNSGKLPQPVSVTTTKVVGTEVDPLEDPSKAPAPPVAEPPAEPAPPPAAVPPPESSEADNLAALVPQQAKDEAAFTKAVSASRDQYNNAGDDDRAALQSARAAAICNAVKKPDISGWVGSIKEIDKDAGGRTILAVALPDGTLVKTWNNAMSDIEDKTLILAGNPLAATVGKLSAGDTVRFSGKFFTDEPDCYRSSRLSLDQSMLEPSFLFRFTDIQKL